MSKYRQVFVTFASARVSLLIGFSTCLLFVCFSGHCYWVSWEKKPLEIMRRHVLTMSYSYCQVLHVFVVKFVFESVLMTEFSYPALPWSKSCLTRGDWEIHPSSSLVVPVSVKVNTKPSLNMGVVFYSSLEQRDRINHWSSGILTLVNAGYLLMRLKILGECVIPCHTLYACVLVNCECTTLKTRRFSFCTPILPPSLHNYSHTITIRQGPFLVTRFLVGWDKLLKDLQ